MSSILISNGTVITMDEGRVIANGAVYVQDRRIVEVGATTDLRARYQAQAEIDATDRLVLPGLIDGHYHTCQQFLRGTLASLTSKGSTRWPIWKNYLIPFEARLSQEDVYLSGLAAYTNMVKVGTTCFGEHGGRYPEQMARAMREVGIRGLLAESTMDIRDPELPANMILTADEATRRNIEIVETYGGHGDGLIRGCLSLRQIIVCTPGLFSEFARLASRYDALIQMHLAEGTYEVDYAVNTYRRRPAEYLESIGGLTEYLTCAHSVLLSDHEVELYGRYGVKVAHCPSGNLAMLGVAKIPLMRRLGVSIGLGSDGASGGSIDLFERMNLSLVGQLQGLGVPYLDRGAVRAQDVVEMATIGGARAVRWDQGIGSLRAGKLADIIIVDASGFDALPVSEDPYYTIVKCVRGSNVQTVIIDGQMVMRDRQMVTINEEQLRDKLQERVPRLYQEFASYVRTLG